MSDLHACAAKQVVSSPWGAPLLGSPSPFAESHAKDAPRQIPSKFRTSPRFLGLKAWLTCLRTHPNLSSSEPSLSEESQWSLSWLHSDLPCPYPLGTWRLCQSLL